MKFILITGLFIILGGIGVSGGIYYYNNLNTEFEMKQSKLEKDIKNKTMRFEDQLSTYKDYEAKLDKRFKDKEKYLGTKHSQLVKILKSKYGEYDKFKVKVQDSFSALEKDINQREKNLQKWEKTLVTKEQELMTKESILNSINLECKLFDKKKLEKYLRAYKRVSYATLEYVSLACGTNIQGQKINNNACLETKKDRIKAKSILSIIRELSPHVANGLEYKVFSRKASTMMNFLVNIGIIGIGHIGSSLALALKLSGKYNKIYGFDIDKKSIEYAKENNIYDEIVSFEQIQKNDIIFIATNITAIISIINSFSDISEDSIIVDLGSTKKSIKDNIPENLKSNYIGVHPMAGKEYSGVFHADETLFNNQTLIMCDKEKSNNKNIDTIRDIFENLNMNIVYMDSNEHDEHASYVSHMPHIISFSLANSVLKHEQAQNITSLAGGGFNDISRIAKSSPLMWVDIFKNNKDNMLKSLNEFENEFKNAKKMIENEEWDSLSEWIKYANKLQHIL